MDARYVVLLVAAVPASQQRPTRFRDTPSVTRTERRGKSGATTRCRRGAITLLRWNHETVDVVVGINDDDGVR
jgi:hypothetical protein